MQYASQTHFIVSQIFRILSGRLIHLINTLLLDETKDLQKNTEAGLI